MTSPLTGDWQAQLIPWWTQDLLDYTAAVGSMWDQATPFLADPDNDIVTWQALFDVDIAPLSVLPWLAQCVGERIPVGYAEETARDWVRMSPRWMRGTENGIVNAVKRNLTGQQVVQYGRRRRLDGTPDPDCVAIITYTSETPSQTAVLNALRHNVPGDLRFEYQAITISTWALVQAGRANWAALEAADGPTWADVTGALPGFDVW